MDYAQGPMVALGGGDVSYERGTPVTPYPPDAGCGGGCGGGAGGSRGLRNEEGTEIPRGGLGGWAFSYGRGTPVRRA